MRARAASFVALIAVLTPAAHPPPAAAGAWSLDRGEYYTEIQSSLFSTHSYYDRDGNRVGIGVPPKIEDRSVTWRTQAGWKKRLNVLFGLTGRSISGFEGASAAFPTQTGLSEVELGLHWRVVNGPRAVAVEADWTGPAGYDRQLSRALGDGRQQFSGRLALGGAIGSRGWIDLAGGGSYRFHTFSPDDIASADPRLATNIYYDVGAQGGFWLSRTLFLGGRYRGRMLSTTSAKAGAGVHQVGPMTLTGDDQLDQSLHLAGPMLLYRVDDRLDLAAGSYSTAAGRNTLHFDEFYVTLAFKQSKLKRNQGPAGTAAP